jgi:putative transposase
VSPARRRAAVDFLQRRHKVSERRACKVVDQNRATNRYSPVPGDYEQRLVEAIHKLAERHPRYGYRRVHALLVHEGWAVNVKRVERLWRREDLAVVPRRKSQGQKAIGTDEHSAWALPALSPIHIWSYDFVSVRTLDGGPVRVLNVVDEFTRVALGSHVARSIGATAVVKHLEKLFEIHGKPAMIRSDNGREFVAATVRDWLAERDVKAVFIAKASPQQNCYVERFNGSMRDELLNGETFRTVTETRVVIETWLDQYNQIRPHRALGMKTPEAFAAYCEMQSDVTNERGQ